MLPKAPGTGANRDNQTAALKLLREAGYELRNQRLVHVASGVPLTLNIHIANSNAACAALSGFGFAYRYAWRFS